MSSSILHQCPSCGHASDISLSLAAFIENPNCNQCGLSASESNGKLQDELVALFDRQMTVAQLPLSQNEPITYISQHYHHSSHVVPPPISQPSIFPTTQSVHDVLRQHGLDPDTFSASQLALFQHADVDQQQRLIQTWQVYSRSERATVIPICQNIQSFPAKPAEDLEMNDQIDSIRDDHAGLAEPYMVSGYEAAPPKEPSTGAPYTSSTDPVYRSQQQQWWELTQVGPMESQYGAYEEMNRYHAACGVVQPSWCQN
ncbi:hypothetical protein N7476_004074 [Penicillium atrosanguineum]|uniref:Uncharacterized protein n=2 Tax=Penicillium atrosanguineum TaxID=1132637 RepID=A0A9W9Q3D5_9EURO|nr:hypothetical protein N7476_004074 [Penicillium atrosanguineum]